MTNLAHKIIAVDFDGTLFENRWPEIGHPITRIHSYIKDQQAKGAKVILWTCRQGELLEAAVKECAKYGLIFDAVNENLPEVMALYGGDTRKISADEYIDDKNVFVGYI